MLFHFEKDSNNNPNSTFLWHAPLIYTHIIHVYAEYESITFKQKEISQKLLKPNFKAFWQSEEGFQRDGFLYAPSPPRDFMPPKSQDLTGLKYQMDLQSCLSYQVNNTKNVFSFKRIEKSGKDVNFCTALKNAKVISLECKNNWKTCNHYSQEVVSSWSCTYCIDEDKACITSSRYCVQTLCEGSNDFTNVENFCSFYFQMLEEFHCMARLGTS